MTDSVYRFSIPIKAAPAVVFDYCLDPRRIYAGDPAHEVVEASVA